MLSKILIIGSRGQLAFDLKRILSERYEILGATRDDFDVRDRSAAERFIAARKPDLVINTAAYHKTEECEANPEESFAVNALGAYNVSRAAALIGAGILFFSTDYVFDGSREFFTEKDQPNPINVYGSSKLTGEFLTKIANPNHYIIRTSWLFGIHQGGKGYNFVVLMLDKAKRGEKLGIVNDQFGSPTYTRDLGFKVKELIDKNAPYGIYHISNSGSCSWYEFARAIFELSDIKPKTFMSISGAVRSNSAVKRPIHSALKSVKLKKAGIEPMRFWKKALAAYIDEIKNNLGRKVS